MPRPASLRVATNLPEPREIFWPAFKQCVSSNPAAAHWIGALTALYLHLGPFSRTVMATVEQNIDAIEAGGFDPRTVGGRDGARATARLRA